MTTVEWYARMREEDYPWMTDDQWECFLMLCDLFGGAHHITGKVHGYGVGIETSTFHDFSTFDMDLMTQAVFMAHDRCIRLAVSPSSPRLIRLCLWKRHERTGATHERHPTLEEAVARWRERYPEVDK